MHEILVIYATITNQSEITALPVRCKIDFLILEKLKIQFCSFMGISKTRFIFGIYFLINFLTCLILLKKEGRRNGE